MKALDDVMKERARQDAKWGEQNHPDEVWHLILTEEVGEAAESILEFRFGMGGHGDVRKEAIEACAVALAWVECIDRRNDG